MLVAVVVCSLSAWCLNPSPAVVGIAISQCNDFSQSKKMLTNDGYVYNSKQSTNSCAVYEYPANYADEAITVKVYRLGKTNKVEKCVIKIGQKYMQRYASELTKHGYRYTNTYGYSIKPFQALAENGRYAAGEQLKNGWFVVTFFQWGQDVDFDK